jgi:hypothetical protein
MKPALERWLRSRWLWRVASLLALALVFAAYLQPDLVFDLANRVWSCF